MKKIMFTFFWLSFLIFTTNLAFADLNDGLVAYYPFDGNASDESGMGNDGTSYGGVDYVDGAVGEAASFDGINDFVAIPSNSIRSLSIFTVSALVKVKVYPGNQAAILMHDRQNGDFPPNKHFQFLLVGNSIYSGWESGSGANRNIVFGPFAEDYATEWVHLVLTRDSDGLGKFYINSALKDTTSGSIETNNSDDLLIGAIRETASLGSEVLFFNGLVDEVKIWNHALSESEIRNLYSLPIADAGPDKIICNQICDEVVLDGTKSYDLNGEIVAYEWELVHGEEICDRSVSGESPTVDNLCPGAYDVRLTVTDDDGLTSLDHIELTVLETCDPCLIMQGDFDSDGDVDGDDLKIFSGHFGKELIIP